MELSVCIVVRDEERLLPQAVASVREHATQVVVVDVGDERLARARLGDAPGLLLEEHPGATALAGWERALGLATGEWLLCMASSERMSPELARKLEVLEANGQLRGMAGFTVRRHHWVLGRRMRTMGLGNDEPLRLLRREGTRPRPGGLEAGFAPGPGPVGRLAEALERSALPGIDDFLRAADRRTRDRLLREGIHLERRRLATAGLATWSRLYLGQGGWREGLPGALWAGLVAGEAFMLEMRRWIAAQGRDAGLGDGPGA